MHQGMVFQVPCLPLAEYKQYRLRHEGVIKFLANANILSGCLLVSEGNLYCREMNNSIQR